MIPQPVPGAVDPTRRGSSVTFTGGVLLAACFFLPAVQGCNSPVYPYEVPQLASPYLLGLLAAVLALVRLLGRRRPPTALLAAHLVLVVGSALALGVCLHVLAMEDGSPPQGPTVWLAGLWWLVAIPLAGALRWNADLEWRAARATSTGATCSLLWFTMWLATEKVYIGLWLSVAGCVLLLAGGLLRERELEAAGLGPAAATPR